MAFVILARMPSMAALSCAREARLPGPSRPGEARFPTRSMLTSSTSDCAD
jgi:hypothetical protein